MKVRLPSDPNFFRVAALIKKYKLHTICESGRCPNRAECWSRKTATFMILGDICTRNCAFCAVTKGRPGPLDPGEPAAVAEAAAILGIKYAVVTSVTRDDLADGGAAHFAKTVGAIRRRNEGSRVEILIPDFQGSLEALETVLESGPEVINHNVETVPSLYRKIWRPARNYSVSLGVLRAAAERGALTKSGLMVGLGESEKALIETMKDLRSVNCQLLTVGQYLQPTLKNPPVEKYYTPAAFEDLKTEALKLGFKQVASGPLVRSSYLADPLYEKAKQERTEK